MKDNENSLSFCPHCGQDLRSLADSSSAEAKPPQETKRKRIWYREVPNTEVEAMWGMTPLPAGMKPFGVVTDGVSDVPQALACESLDGRMWECMKGKTILLDLDSPLHDPTKTVPAHVVNAMIEEDKEEVGKERWGA